MGGSDQWGNITTGTELIRRIDSGKAYALTTPLVTKSDGTKFGKSESGNVWLDSNLTSPYKFYQFWLNVSDEEAGRLIKVFTLLSKAELEALITDHQAAPHLRILQKALAQEVTTRVHSAEDYLAALQASEILFGKGDINALKALPEDLLLAVFEGVPLIAVAKNVYAETSSIVEFLADATQFQIFESRGEAKRMLQNGGISINREKVTASVTELNFELLQGKYLVIQKGKKNYYLVAVE
ncbi:Tyrosine--tRNA ligase [Adhaeribacter pallidiroseus]|uniref:Tyrosine--tRNA ligase n=1 Tax=Adhaeribacter pallidiroseus TaxID=2072847 RepID=A0A369QLB6_9BACT|nr:Tyrosine--tRNA ligase [Adhaeribacter pallidiroseus]